MAARRGGSYCRPSIFINIGMIWIAFLLQGLSWATFDKAPTAKHGGAAS